MERLFLQKGICVVLILSILGCVGSGTPQQSNTPIPSQQIQQKQAQLPVSATSTSPYFNGDGRKDMSLAILVPESQDIDKDHAYLPSLIQGYLVANISKYSAIKVLDRVALDKVISETLNPVYKDNLDIVRLGHITQTGYIMTGTIIKKSYDYALTINVTDTTPNPQTKAYSGNYTISQLEDQTAIQLASKDLLTQMGVKLSDMAIAELSTTNQRAITAQTVLAKGITAQRQGFEIEALSYYFQAAKFDPSLPEAANRSEVLAANVSSGHIGDDMRNLVQWRKDWIARIAETEQYVKNYNDYYYKYYTDYYNNFYKEYNASWDSLVSQENAILNQRGTFINNLPAPPYTLYYAVDMRPSGVIDYRTETTSFTGIKVLLRGGSAEWKRSIEKAVQELIASEREMRKAEQDLQEKIAEVQRTVRTEQAAIEAAMREVVRTVNDGLNATGRREEWQLKPLNAGLTNAQFNPSLLKTAKPDVLPINKTGTPSFSVNVQLVNSKNKVIGASTFTISGTYSITNNGASVSDDARSAAGFANVNVNDVTDNLTIRIASVNGIPAENTSRSGGLQIQAVNAAEWDSAPWDYTIQKGKIIQYMGKGGSVTIPRIIWGETVTSIGDNAFANSQLTSITIGANIILGSPAIGSRFEDFYNHNGKLAGTYIRRDSNSSTWGKNREELDFSFDPATGTITDYTGNTENMSPVKITIPETICGIPVTAIGIGVFHLKEIKSVIWQNGDNSGHKPGETFVVIKIGKGIKVNKSAFTGPNFGACYLGHGRKAGTYSYLYTSNIPFKILLCNTTFIIGIIISIFIPDGQWTWQYTPGYN
ncbi:coiled-coil domain-containing protein [Treponema sp. R80B11-R83G3]